MNTDPKNQERVQGLQLHPEQTSPNTNPMNPAEPKGIGTNEERRIYKVTVHRTDYLYTVVPVEAESEDEAETKAEEVAALLPVADWDVADRDLYTYAVEVKEGGKSDVVR